LETIEPLEARLKNGRLVMDEPTDLPEGTELTLTVADDADDFAEQERARLHESLRRGVRDA
jgi:hypothetical protein